MKPADLPAYSYVNGDFVRDDEAVISIKDRGFRFGDGVFETILVYESVPFQWKWHMQRLSEGLSSINIPYDVSSIRNIAKKLFRMNHFTNGFLRISVTRGAGSKGYLPDGIIIPTLIMELVTHNVSIEKPVSVMFSNYVKVDPSMLPIKYKLMQGLQSSLARMEAQSLGCFESILLNKEGYLTEGSSSNLFWLKDEVLYTPSDECGILRGSIRNFILNESGFNVRQGTYTPDVLVKADSIILTNVAWGILPVAEIVDNDYKFAVSDIVVKLRDILREAIVKNSQHRW